MTRLLKAAEGDSDLNQNEQTKTRIPPDQATSEL